jgi:ABC-type polysaccharide/polyol phosphate export permease
MTSGAAPAVGSGGGGRLSERLVAHIDIMLALGARELRARFSQNSLGYAWTFVAPLVWVAATYLSFYLFGRTSPVYTDTITFIISGIIPYAAFRYTVTAVGRVNTAVRGLLIFPSVRHEHAIVTVALLEFVNIFIVFAVVAAANYLIFGNGELDNIPQFVAGVALAWGLGSSYGYLFSVLGRFNPTLQQAGVVLLRPTFFLSAVFFTANELPESLLNVLIWNPVLHATEIARDGMLFHYQSRVASAPYVLVWIVAMTVAGLAVSTARKS